MGRWVDAEDLQAGDELLSSDGTTVVIDTISDRSAVGRVHNLTVEGIHTYHVAAGDEQVLAHNCGDTLFRGTTDGYPGSPALQQAGVTPTSTDPAVATAFGTHGQQFGDGVVHIASPADLTDAKKYPPSLGGLESEVGVGL